MEIAEAQMLPSYIEPWFAVYPVRLCVGPSDPCSAELGRGVPVRECPRIAEEKGFQFAGEWAQNKPKFTVA
jgi:hypothetical protein